MSVWSLWLPMLLTGLATHVMSTLAWMVLPHHKPEWLKLEQEGELSDWLKEKGVAAGQYLFPYPEQPEGAKREGGCQGTLILWGKPPNMGAAIGCTLAFFFVTAWVIGYLASLGLGPGAPFLDVFQFVFTAALLAHCFALFPGNFWFPRRVAMDLVDKVAYAVVTALLFAALWPAAS